MSPAETGATLPPWPDPPLQIAGLRLRQVSLADVAAVCELATDPYVPTIGSLPHNASAAQGRAWIERQWPRHAAGLGYPWAIADALSDRMLGTIGLGCKDFAAGTGSVGYAVLPSARGFGVAALGLAAVTEFAWRIGLRRLEAHIEHWNAASIRTVEKVGFHLEAVLPGHQEIGGELRDMMLFVADRPPSQVKGTRSAAVS